ncbi:hypothetical protein CVT24_011455 [Panaeolus cyanescens]|uniref:Tc1-like transposase DDE domain-containing protein n=1 Tax=Panaeolus cyanescens TaxID=181874 RepID=A0A409YGS8_9AGAR|nr:hypothetical protein CVT24_011455 [Panaeolus cyanescens]
MIGNRCYISRETKENIVVLSAYMKTRQVAEMLQVSDRTVRRVKALAQRTGRVNAPALAQGRPRKLSSADAAYLISLVERTPDLYLYELQALLQDALGVYVTENTISATLRRQGFTRKKVSMPALERNEDLRAEYQTNIGENYAAEQLVFVDESACNRNTTKRLFGWAPTGQRSRRHDYFIRGQRYSILPALSLDGVLHLDVINRSYTQELFDGFIDGLLDNMNPFPARNSVIVMDNASIHKSQALREMIEARGMRLVFLPAYSPDLNPIEEGFSAMKAWIKEYRDEVRGELLGEITCNPYDILWVGVFSSMTPSKAEGWFRDCGYL